MSTSLTVASIPFCKQATGRYGHFLPHEVGDYFALQENAHLIPATYLQNRKRGDCE